VVESERKRCNLSDREEDILHKKKLLDRLAIHFPVEKLEEKPVERLIHISKLRDRSINYLAMEAIFDYLDREEKQSH